MGFRDKWDIYVNNHAVYEMETEAWEWDQGMKIYVTMEVME